jgi:putative flippase GtrA
MGLTARAGDNNLRFMFKLYKPIEDFWFAKVPQKLRFVLVGGFNTCAAYLIFAGLYTLSGRYGFSVALQYLISMNISVVTMRYYVFRGRGSFAKEYSRAVSVYAFMLALNYLALYVLVEKAGVEALSAQAGWIVAETVAVYFLHKYFSFR